MTYSLLHNATVRTLPVALAHCFAVTKIGEASRMELLTRLYDRLPFSQQAECRAEMMRCRAARRGQAPADVAFQAPEGVSRVTA